MENNENHLVEKELDEIKILYAKSKIQRKLELKRKMKWKLLSLLEMIILIAILTVSIIININNNTDSAETFNNAERINNTLPNVEANKNNTDVKKTVKLVNDLEEIVKNINSTITADNKVINFTASVKELYGYEYLCFTDGSIHIYYRNEFLSEGDDQRDRIVIDNGSRRAEYYWDYDLTSDIYDLCPYAGDYALNGSCQLVFAIKEKEYKKYTELRIVDVYTLWEYDKLDFEKTFSSLFSYELIDNESEADNLYETASQYMKIRVTSTDYKYIINSSTYEAAKLYNINPLNTTQNITITAVDGTISLLSVITVSENEYLGQLSADLVLGAFTYSLENIKYGAYVNANQEDIDLNGMIIPRTKPIDNYVTIHGNQGERFIIQKSTVLKPFNYDLESISSDEKGIKTYYLDGISASHIGIDVSRYQGTIDWKKVAGAGVEFAFIRLGYRGMNRGEGNGNLSYDEGYDKNIKEALDAGINVGVYFFSQAITIEEAVGEAEMVIEGLKGYDITYPVVFDTEAVYVNGYSARANDLTRQQRTDIAKVFCETIKNAGYQPMIYANTKWMIMGIDLEQLDEYPRWFAYYGNSFLFPYDIQIWQYSDSGKIPGISGNVDLNISFIDFSR